MTKCNYCKIENGVYKCGNGCGTFYCSDKCSKKEWPTHACIGADIDVKNTKRTEVESIFNRMTKKALLQQAELYNIDVRDFGIKVDRKKFQHKKSELVRRLVKTLSDRGVIENNYKIISPTTILSGPYKDVISVIMRNASFEVLLTMLQSIPQLYRLETQDPLQFWESAFFLYFPEYAFAVVPEKIERLPHDNEQRPIYYKLCAWATWAHRRILKYFAKNPTTELIKETFNGNELSSIRYVKFLGKRMAITSFAVLNGFPRGALLAFEGDTEEKNTDVEDYEDKVLINEQKEKRENLMKKIESDMSFAGDVIADDPLNFVKFMSGLCKTHKNDSISKDLIRMWRALPIDPRVKRGKQDIITIGEQM